MLFFTVCSTDVWPSNTVAPMNVVNALQYSIGLIFSSRDIAAFTLATLGFFASFIILGFFGGRLWNRKWGVFTHPATALVNGIFSIGLSACILAWMGADRSASWLEVKRESVRSALSLSGTINREVMKDAWEKI